MRVSHVITRLIVGGAQENTLFSVLGLRNKPGLSVDLISGPTSGPEGTLEPQAASVPGLLTVVPDLVRPPSPSLDLQAYQSLVRIFRSIKPDIVHTHSGKAGILGRLAARKASVPVIIHTIHGPSFGPFQGALANWAFRTAERHAARHTTHFVSVANAMTRQYLAAGIGRDGQFTRIFSGFDVGEFVKANNSLELRARLGIRPDDFVIGKIGRLFKLKGHDDLFKAAPSIVARVPNVRFLLVGGGEWRERFERMAQDLGMRERFIFTGLVSPEQVPAYTGIMDALVHLSTREGLARALPQALAAGKPVVAYDCDGASEVCIPNETGFLVKPGDLSGLVESITLLARDPGMRAKYGKTGRDLVISNFTVEKMVDDLHALYLRLSPA